MAVPSQLQKTLATLAHQPHRLALKNRSISDINRKFEEQHAQERAAKLGIKYTNLLGFPIDQNILQLIPPESSRRGQVVAFMENAHLVSVGMVDPAQPDTQAALQTLKTAGYTIAPFLISPSSFTETMSLYDTANQNRHKPQSSNVSVSAEELNSFSQQIKNIDQLKNQVSAVPISQVISVLIAGALSTKASDIHLEPEESGIKLRYRIDGVLQDILDFPKSIQGPITSRIKIVSQLKLNVTQTPQDGRFTIEAGAKKVDVRVSLLPSAYGETIVMRLLGTENIQLKIESLGIREPALSILRKAIRKPHGMVLTTGPTGSGKTTTLYAFLNEINNPEVKIITLENPIEYRLNGISQTQIDKEKGYDFAAGLRAILRQDPDVVMIGEIRDLETADTAVNAALTGHLVFSTLHTNDAAGVIPRLTDMGVRPFVIPPALNAVIAQRLVRRLCPQCKETFTPTPKDLEEIKQKFAAPGTTETLPEIKTLYRARGCEACNKTGYQGRIGIYEVFEVDPEIEKLTLSGGTTAEIQETAVKRGMRTMAQDGILKALEGITDFHEVCRVA